MSLDSVLARGRAAHLQLMRDTVTITRPGSPTFDPVTFAEATTATTVYTGPADVKAMSAVASTAQAGEREITTRNYDIKLPFTTPEEFHLDDLVRVDASEDASFVGVILTVIDVQHGARRTARHLIAEDRA